MAGERVTFIQHRHSDSETNMIIQTDNAFASCYDASELRLAPGDFPETMQLYDAKVARALRRGEKVLSYEGEFIAYVYTQIGCDANTGADVMVVNS